MTTATATLTVKRFRAPEGCQAHLVIDPVTGTGLVIDPRLDQVDEILDRAQAENARIDCVIDTHTHADHLSGVRRIAARTGAQILAHPRSKTDASRLLEDGEEFLVGEMRVEVIHSPGHTPDSLSLLIDGHLFTGDALFAGGAGRTDFMGGSASALYESFRRFESLPEDTVVHPGHDYVGRPTTTIGTEKRENPLMMEGSRDALVARLDIKGPLPSHMKAILSFNTKGPSEKYISPIELDAIRHLRDNVHIVDVRNPGEFLRHHIDEAANIPLDQFENRMGEIPSEREVIVVCQSGVRSVEAAHTLERAGRVARQLEGGMVAWNQAGLPASGRGGLSIERQVQLIVGLGALVGSVLAALASPWFLVIPAFLGAGLTWAGATGTCRLALVLGRMPWNQHEEERAGSACAATTTSTCAAVPDTPKGRGKA